MFFIIGVLIVISAVIGGFLGSKGNLGVLWMPFEFIIIFGAGIGAFIISNPKPVISGVIKSLGTLLSGAKYDKSSYLELLGALYVVFRLAKTKGDLALESHVERPEDSPLFQQFPKFAKDHHAMVFFCDYLRLLTLGTSNAHELEAIMDQELEIHHDEMHAISGAVTTLGDALPALGIVAAVLGIIITMGSITEPPEVLGHLIGGALVGTFAGILMSYGFVAPMGKFLEQTFNAESRYMQCIKIGVIAHVQGYAPQVSIEFARKSLLAADRPTFQEVEEMVGSLTAA